MSKRIFTKEQIEDLLNNKNVEMCSDRSITFSKDFKTNVVTLYEHGLTSTEIFRQAGFNFDVIGKNTPKECLRRWNKIIRRKGLEGLSEVRGKNSSGRPREIRDKTDKDKIKRLEIEIESLKAENVFLAKLRAKRTE